MHTQKQSNPQAPKPFTRNIELSLDGYQVAAMRISGGVPSELSPPPIKSLATYWNDSWQIVTDGDVRSTKISLDSEKKSPAISAVVIGDAGATLRLSRIGSDGAREEILFVALPSGTFAISIERTPASKLVYVVVWKSSQSLGYDWYYDKAEADAQYEREKTNTDLYPEKGQTVYRFEQRFELNTSASVITEHLTTNLLSLCRQAGEFYRPIPGESASDESNS